MLTTTDYIEIGTAVIDASYRPDRYDWCDICEEPDCEDFCAEWRCCECSAMAADRDFLCESCRADNPLPEEPAPAPRQTVPYNIEQMARLDPRAAQRAWAIMHAEDKMRRDPDHYGTIRCNGSELNCMRYSKYGKQLGTIAQTKIRSWCKDQLELI